MMLARSLFVVLIAVCFQQVSAEDISLQNLNESDMKKVVGDMSNAFLHTTVSGASPLGHIFGFEIGLVGGVAQTPKLQELAREVDSTTNVSSVPHGALIGALTVPLGLTAEVGLVPSVGSSEFKFNTASAAVKWTPTELLLSLPFSLAVKGSYTQTAVTFSSTINNVLTEYDYTNKQYALTLLASKSLAVVEPYVGLGVVSAKGDLSATGSANVFDQSFTGSGSGSASRSGALFLVGTEANLLFVKLGVEYSRLFDTSRFTGKLSVYF